MYAIEYSETARKQIHKLARDLQERIITTLERIRVRPEVYVTKLVGEPEYKLRVGDYRIILDIQKEKLIILLLKAGHRKNIYDKA
ncbi:type II toxin-antitoxin system RelE/ParE family toxin [Candidatus Woesearchaeota archaeon]|nr:type II toxin-antitoxin system RelE/ParE family toxin [Candidatus Woesearchaeota archaeon]